jgi:S1-C subfamily serine protease
MDVLDLIVILVAVGAAVLGFRLGFLTRITSWIGLGLGFYLGARLLPRLVNATGLASAGNRLLLAVAVLIVGTMLGYGVGLIAGARLHEILPGGPMQEVDRGVGAAAGAVGVFVALWLLLPALSSVAGWPARATQGSAISRWVSTQFPRAPDVFQALRRYVGQEGFPQVFQSLGEGGSVSAPPSASPLVPAVSAAVAQSTVKVEGQACDRIQDGSGFAVGPDLVATNAHVVAGEPGGHTQVLTYAGRTLAATVVLFDANRDLALLSVPRLDDKALPIGAGTIGENVAAFGHPEGQDPLAVTPAAIAKEIEAIGSNLYGTKTTTRDVYILSANLAPGDSGSPTVTANGTVVGVVFAIAEGQANTAYALTSKELTAVLGEPHTSATSTGDCLNA